MKRTMEEKVMGNVGAIYAARQLYGRAALKLYAFAASSVALWQFTWVHKIAANWAHVGFAGTWQYVSYAVMHTHLPVQLALIIAFAAGISLGIDALRALGRPGLRFA